jgi:hypothetical protein
MNTDIVASILCFIQNILDTVFSLLNSTVGALLGIDFEVPDIGCEE